jgi:hypothetical protein
MTKDGLHTQKMDNGLRTSSLLHTRLLEFGK